MTAAAVADAATPVGLRLDGVGVSYGRAAVVAGVTTPRLDGGTVVALIGPNGSGKSTLMKRIAGLVPGDGRVDHGGVARREIGYMPQDHASTAALTVYKSVILAAKQEGGWRVSDAELARIDDTLAALGIADLAFRDLSALSGGQRQLVSIAQTLVREPRILMMDEPTSALDLHRQMEVLGLVRRLATERGILVLVSLHDLNQVLRFADQALILARGRLHACGPSRAVITEAMMREVYRVEARLEVCSRGLSHLIVDANLERT